MERRKDSRGRVLNDGEVQRSDGRYVYQYVDAKGKRRSVYSWKLLPADRTPSGKRKDISLREKEKRIKEDISNGVIPEGAGLTVCGLVEKYIAQKTGVRHSTRVNYQFVLNVIQREGLGFKRIDKLKTSDAKEWFIVLQANGTGYSSIRAIHGVLNPAFQMAVEDDLLRKNPFDFKLSSVVKNDSTAREALSLEQQNSFLNFIKNDRHFCQYYDGIYILFHTGLRISEFCGLTLQEIDFKNQKIVVEHQLQRRHDMVYEITETKTASGVREVPMTKEVSDCFERIIQGRRKPRVEPMIGGRTNFVFLDRNGMPTVAMHWEKYFREICTKYNSVHNDKVLNVTPHICRHTFCSNMAKKGMNPKTLQYIMGHSNIGVTLNVYTHINFENAQAEMRRVQLTKG